MYTRVHNILYDEHFWLRAILDVYWCARKTKHVLLLYQPEPKPVVYIVPIQNILGRLALAPYGEHGTIPYDWRHLHWGSSLVHQHTENKHPISAHADASCTMPVGGRLGQV